MLAANGTLSLLILIVCGPVGAVVGDPTMFWISRLARGRLGDWLARTSTGKAGAHVIAMFHTHHRVFLLF